MKKYYIPTSSLNFNNILSSESISPKAFYSERSFGYGRWIEIPENPYQNSIVLYDQLCAFARPKSDYEDHPLLFEICLDDRVESSLVSCGNHMYLSDRTIYIDPFSTSIYFFSEEDKRITLSMSDSSIETKVVKLYIKKMRVIAPPEVHFPEFDPKSEPRQLNRDEVEKDKRINKMKGLLYGFYIGAILSSHIEDVRKLNKAREIRDILAAILAGFDHEATPQQRARLGELYIAFQPELPFLTELRSILKGDKAVFDAVVSLIREEYGYIKGELNVDRIINRLLARPTSPDVKNPEVEWVSSLIRSIENDIASKSMLLKVQDRQVVLEESDVKLSIDGLSEQDTALCEAWLNEVLSSDKYSGKTSTFKTEISDDVTMTARSVFASSWDKSSARVVLNALRRHIRGDEYDHEWGNDIYSAISALILKGDDWQKMLQFMQEKEMTDYRIPFAMYGTINGFAGIPRDFTDILYGKESAYIAEVYKEFYRQLFGREVVASEIAPTEAENLQTEVDEDMPDFENESTAVGSTDISGQPCAKDEAFVKDLNRSAEFDSFFADMSRVCKRAQKDETIYRDLFIKYGGCTLAFLEAVELCTRLNKGKGPLQNVLKFIENKINAIEKLQKSAASESTEVNLELPFYPESLPRVDCLSGQPSQVLKRLEENWLYTANEHPNDDAEHMRHFMNLCKKEGRGEMWYETPLLGVFVDPLDNQVEMELKKIYNVR